MATTLGPTDDMLAFPAPVPFYGRGVYCYAEDGQTVYVAITSTGALLNGERRRQLADESQPMIEREMWRDLNAQDPMPTTTARPRFALWVDGEQRR